MNSLKALFSRRFILPTIIVVLGMLFLARLGFWQLDRLAQRRAENAVLAAALAESPLELTGDETADDVSLIGNQRAIARGTFDFDEQLIWKLQISEGRTGFNLLTPLLLDEQTAVLINRGWLPASALNDGSLPTYNTPTDETAVYGYLAATQPQPEPNDTPQHEWYRVDVAAIDAQLPYDLLPFYLVQINEDEDAANSLPIHGKLDVELSEGSHMVYAMQWFAFSLILGIMYLAYVHKQSKTHDAA